MIFRVEDETLVGLDVQLSFHRPSFWRRGLGWNYMA